MKIRRGDILYVDLGVQYQGSIQGSMRPVVVVSNNMANKHSTVITVVPLSTKINKKRNLPTHVFVSAYKSEGLEQHSIALCEQVTALDYGRIIENMGKVDKDTLARITESIRHISLRRSWDGINMLQFSDIIKRQCLLQKIYNITMQLQTHLIVSYFLQGSDQERYNGKSQENQMVGLMDLDGQMCGMQVKKIVGYKIILRD